MAHFDVDAAACSEDEIEVLFNDCYGRWTPSEKAVELYVKTRGEGIGSRHDPVLVDIFKKLGNRFDANDLSETAIKKIPKKYKDYYEIRENDGLEMVAINYKRYEFDKLKNEVYMMKKILKDDTNTDEKFEKISRLITNAII